MKSKKIKKPLNIYATNFRFASDDKSLKYLSKLTNFLTDNEWLKISKDKYHDFTVDKQIYDNMISDKPNSVSWFSKGGWIFYELCCNIDSEIIYVTVDYKNIYKITNKSPYSDISSNSDYESQLKKFNRKYNVNHPSTKTRKVHKKDFSSHCNWIHSKEMCGPKNKYYRSYTSKTLNGNKCKWNKTKNRCEFTPCTKKHDDCVNLYNIQLYNWSKFFKDYDGLAIYPMMSLKEMEDIQNHHGFDTWDVETLILSNSTPITKHHNLGTIRELLNIKDKDSNTINYSKLIQILIKKIIDIRNTI
jgi:hypothetical protein